VRKTTVKDIDGNSYKTVKIGYQIWMAESLKVDHYRNGDLIPDFLDKNEWAETSEGSCCYYNDVNTDDLTGQSYGRLYNMHAIIDKRGLAPKGWHVPTKYDWEELIDYLGGWKVAGGILKSKKFWMEPNVGATNESGFNAFASGFRTNSRSSYNYKRNFYKRAGDLACFWTSTMDDSKRLVYMMLRSHSTCIDGGIIPSRSGLSVRCVRDKREL
jgi:uncharacterized protein (TIGR02145 family)